ncbi:Desiccation-related protein PCC13-62 [Capsicum annuum]|nr:desiccation-related protein PCC13-62 [Capsicum annuum]KAF3659949.1 Desiccation-related protein PCC13-62 [Capsicum annuum]
MPTISITSPPYFLIFMILMASMLMCISHSQDFLCPTRIPQYGLPVYKKDIDLLQFSENLEFLEAEYYLWATHGYGLDIVAPELVMGGPPPIGVHRANLDLFTRNIITEFAMQEVGHLRALKSKMGGFPRPLMDLSANHFAKLFDEAFGYKLEPPFDPYRDSLNFMLSCYALPYAALVGYVGMNPLIKGYETKRLLAGLLGVESGQDAIIRMYLYERAGKVVYPYKHTVAEFTIHISNLRNRLAMCGTKEEGLFVPWQLGAENLTTTNILSADIDSLSQRRTPAEILRIVYNTGNEHARGGFFPHGANGNIARKFLKLY